MSLGLAPLRISCTLSATRRPSSVGARIRHQPTPLNVTAVGIDCRHAALLNRFDNRLNVGEKVAYVAYDDRASLLLRDLGEHALILKRREFLERHTDHGDF